MRRVHFDGLANNYFDYNSDFNARIKDFCGEKKPEKVVFDKFERGHSSKVCWDCCYFVLVCLEEGFAILHLKIDGRITRQMPEF